MTPDGARTRTAFGRRPAASGVVGADRAGTRAWVALAIVAAGWMLFWHLGALPLLNHDEGRNASIAWEMQAAGHWLVPTYDGLAYLDKPAMFFKLVGLSLAAFGHNEFAARLPSALFAGGLLIMLFGFCRREYGVRTAAVAVAVVATAPLFFAFARIVIFDMTLAFFVCASIFAGYRGAVAEGTERARWDALAAAAAGVATLVKGPVGMLVPLLVLVVFHRTGRIKGATRALLSPRNGLIFLVIVAPWFIGLSLARPDFPYYGIVEESLLRFTTNTFHRSGPFYYYLPVLLGTFFPWSFIVPEAALAAWRRRRQLAPADRLFIVWAIVVVLFFSVSQSKLPGYVLSVVVALGPLVARVLIAAMARPEGVAARIVRHAALVVALLLAAGAGVLLAYHFDVGHLRQLLHMKADAAQGVLALALPGGIALGLVAALAATGAVRRDARAAAIAFVCLPVLVLPLALPVYGGIAGHRRSDRLLAERTAPLADGATIACLRCFPSGLPFYLRRRITVLTEHDGKELTSNYVPYHLAAETHWPPQIVPIGQLDTWLARQHKPVLLIAHKYDAARLKALAAADHGTARQFTRKYWAVRLSPGNGG